MNYCYYYSSSLTYTVNNCCHVGRGLARPKISAWCPYMVQTDGQPDSGWLHNGST